MLATQESFAFHLECIAHVQGEKHARGLMIEVGGLVTRPVEHLLIEVEDEALFVFEYDSAIDRLDHSAGSAT